MNKKDKKELKECISFLDSRISDHCPMGVQDMKAFRKELFNIYIK